MADTTNATYDGGIYVPHWNLSDAKISIIFETSKQFHNNFSPGIKNNGTQALKTCVPYVLSYYNNYVLSLIKFTYY